MKHVLSNHRRLLAAAVLSSTVVLSACGGAEGATSLLDQKRPASPWSEATETASSIDASHESEARVDAQPGLPQSNEESHNSQDSEDGAGTPADSALPGDSAGGAPSDQGDDHLEVTTPPQEEGAAEIPAADSKVVLMWSPPTERENGEYLLDTELGGYEIRYRKSELEDYEVIVIENGLITEYEFTDLDGDFEFEIAVFDSSGLYSVFVAIKPFG
jgi:hypothetical protein